MLGNCSLCGKETHSLTMVDDETWVCDDCFEPNYFQCDVCLKYWPYNSVEHFHLKKEKIICEYCKEDYEED